MSASVRTSDGVARRRRAWLPGLLVAVPLLGGMAGCIIIPTPGLDSGETRTNISRKTTAQFTPGRTTRPEIVLALGEPDAVTPDERKLAYRREKTDAFWFAAGGYNAAGGSIESDRYLVAEFDAAGLMQKIEWSRSWCGSRDPDRILATGFATNRDAAIRVQHPANWLAGVDGYRPKHAAEMSGLPGRLCLTEQELRFYSKGQFANEPPALLMPYASISAVQVDKFLFGRRLVVRGRAGEIDCFEVLGSMGVSLDRQALEEVRNLLQSKINQPTP